MTVSAKELIAVALICVVALFMTVSGVGIGVDMFFNADPRATDAYCGGFIGAFFAFLFVRLSGGLGASQEREVVQI